MGQMAVGILYGCEAPDIPRDEKDEEVFYDIVEEFNILHAKIIDYEKPRIRVEREGNKTLIGVWIAVGGSGEDGAPYFVENCIPVDQIETVYEKSINKAKKLWARFVKYLYKKHQIELHIATLWLTPCEVA